MGGNMSRMNDGRTQVANATLIPNNNNKKPYACAPYPSSYKAPANYNTSTNDNNVLDFKTYRPSDTVVSTTTVGTAKRVTAFHSAARWREYFEASKHSNKLIVIYFTATWCGPCKYMEPTINELAAKYGDVDIVKIDVDELFNVSREFGIQTMPTFMFMKKGNQIDKVVGAKKEELQRKTETLRVY